MESVAQHASIPVSKAFGLGECAVGQYIVTEATC